MWGHTMVELQACGSDRAGLIALLRFPLCSQYPLPHRRPATFDCFPNARKLSG